MYQDNMPGRSTTEARRLTVAQYIREETEKMAPTQSQLQPEHITEAVHVMLRRASRWTALVEAIDSAEILLVDQTKHVMQEHTTIGQVLEAGTDEEFEELKVLLLKPTNRVKENCLLLSGVSNMIIALADALVDSDLRRYLAETVKLRIRDVYGEPFAAPGETATEKSKLLCGPPQTYLHAILGIAVVFASADGNENEDVDYRNNYGDRQATELLPDGSPASGKHSAQT